MPASFERGRVVVRGKRYSVVWQDDARGLVLLPLLRPRRALAHDVPLDLPELIACGAPIAHAVVRPRPNAPIARDGHTLVGAVPGQVMCRVVQGLVRAAVEAGALARWDGHAEFRRHASDNRRVNMMVG